MRLTHKATGGTSIHKSTIEACVTDLKTYDPSVRRWLKEKEKKQQGSCNTPAPAGQNPTPKGNIETTMFEKPKFFVAIVTVSNKTDKEGKVIGKQYGQLQSTAICETDEQRDELLASKQSWVAQNGVTSYRVISGEITGMVKMPVPEVESLS